MSEPKFTKGPWSLWGRADPSQVIASETGFVAQTVGGNDEANARLIATAPDLFEALDRLQNSVDQYFGPSRVGEAWPKFFDAEMRAARAALAKASGEPQ